MKSIKEYLKKIGISKQEFAVAIKLSRPTLDAYIEAYENKEPIARERYQIIFDRLFGGDELDIEDFNIELDSLKNLLERDERLGTDKLDTMAADVVSRLRDRMSEDMAQGEWNQAVYTFIDLLISSYRENSIFEKLAEYFIYLNRSELEDEVEKEQIPYFANFYSLFSSMIKYPSEYNKDDYKAFLDRRRELCEEREKDRKKREEEMHRLISDTAKELEEIGLEVTKTDIVKAVLDKLKNNR